jgi:NADP-dependent aldehyde dehydrogenase
MTATAAPELDRTTDDVARRAQEAFAGLSLAAPALRAEALRRAAAALGDHADELVAVAQAETGLAETRLRGELKRTQVQLRLFAQVVTDGAYLDVRLDEADPDFVLGPRPDLRRTLWPVGPVLNFAASNFPFAFSVAGGDTAAALAAGCPVIVKGHSAHPGTSEMVAQAIVEAVRQCDLPDGVFSLLNGNSHALGGALVAHPHIKAVGFTGSRRGGLALMKIASERPEPIPVYAEMSSINPVLLLPGALAARAGVLGAAFVGSMTMGVGQFCTNPGLLIALDSEGLDRFIAAARTALGEVSPAVMLTAGIHGAYEQGVERLLRNPQVEPLARGPETQGKHCGRGALFAVRGDDLLQHPEVMEEVFGASSVIVRCANAEQLLEVLEHLEGQLTATLHLVQEDEALAARLIPVLERKAGRLIANGWPTGVEVSHAMVHGGPFPATSDGRSTSVGTLAIERFLRPVCYQDFPDALLPQALRKNAPARPHRLDGTYRTG